LHSDEAYFGAPIYWNCTIKTEVFTKVGGRVFSDETYMSRKQIWTQRRMKIKGWNAQIPIAIVPNPDISG